MLRRRSPRFLLRAALNRRAFTVAWKMLRIYPRPWSRAFHEPSFRLARQTLRRDAAQKIRELAPLIELLRERPPRTVLEIGSDRGGTLYAWSRVAAPGALIVSIDLPGGDFGRGELDLPAVTRGYARPGQTLRFVLANSHDPTTRDRLLKILNDRKIDFLMIDGDHTYEGVKRDFELYSPLVAQDGLIALHDILPNEVAPNCKVDRFWQEVKQDRRTLEFVDTYDDRGLGQWGGIGVVLPPTAPAHSPDGA